METGNVPFDFKLAQVSPLLKKSNLDSAQLKNYRPVSNLSFISKTLERVVSKQLSAYLAENGIHDKFQSAYKPSHSVETAMLRIKSDMDLILDKGDGILLVLLDLSAAFDVIDHSILFHRLENDVGITGTALKWIQSYLTDRRQAVSIRGTMSSQVSLQFGVPQGSVLGPLLFLMYILPLQSIIDRFHINRHGYADDTQIYCRIPLKDEPDLNICVNNMNCCLVAIRQWMLTNKLKINDSKTECVIVTPKRHIRSVDLDKVVVIVGNSSIKPTTVVTNLGAVLDDHLAMDRQVTKVTRGAYFHLRRIGKIRCHLDQPTCVKIICSTVTSRLDFHNGLLTGVPGASLNRIQLVQNNAARLITGTRKSAHITPILSQLHWLPVKHRITYKILTIIHHAIHTPTAPAYMKDLFTIYRPTRSLRSSSDPWKLSIPRVLRKYGSNSFPVMGATLWNALPFTIRQPVSFGIFKSEVKTYLFRKAFN